MKRKIIFNFISVLIILTGLTVTVNAQKFEFIPFAGYQTSGRINAYQGYFRINDGINYGAAFSISFNEAYRMEVSYSRQPTSLTYTLDNETNPHKDMAVTSVSLGGVVEINPGNTIVPFARVGLGRTTYNPADTSMNKEYVMHFSISSGAKIFINEHIGFRLQACLLLPVFYEGIYFEEAAPAAGQGMKTKLAGVQGDFTAGMLFRF